MRLLKDFFESRMGQVGINGPIDLCRRAGISKPTFYKIVDDPDHSNKGKREVVAAILRFKGWADLIKAFEADDVTWGLLSTADMPYRMPPVPKEPPKMPISKAENELMIAANKLALASLEQKRQLIRELPKETVAAIEEIFSDNKQPPAKRSRKAAKHKQKS